MAKKGFTLIEVTIASTIFTIVSLIGVMVFVNITRTQRRITLENAIYEDGRFMMERLGREIRQNAIDYEEYYNKLVEEGVYGEKYGCYASRFYNPGSDGPENGKLGTYCIATAINPGPTTPEQNPGCTIDKTTLDINTGQNPYLGINFPNSTSQDANGMCDKNFPGSCTTPLDIALHKQSELYLIDPEGKRKMVFALKTFNDIPVVEKALSVVEIDGVDSNQDGIFETWTGSGMGQCTTPLCCASGYDCSDLQTNGQTLEDSLDATAPNIDLFEGFIPISPLRTHVKDLKFYISPLEDPRKAFAESTVADAVQQQPHVTIVMTLEPAHSELTNFAGNPPSVTLQTTVSSRVYNEVTSFTGEGVCGVSGY